MHLFFEVVPPHIGLVLQKLQIHDFRFLTFYNPGAHFALFALTAERVGE